MNLDTPEGRLAVAESLGPDGYNAAMKTHHDASTIANVNGHAIRPVSSRFGTLFAVSGTDSAFATLAGATAYAKGLPPVRDLTLEVSRREDAFLIAAIRLWQQVERGTFALVDKDGNPAGVDYFEDISSCGYEFDALSPVEVDDLACDVFGLDPWLTEEERAEIVGESGQ